MIKIVLSGMCKDCKNADLEIWQEDRMKIGLGKNMQILGGEWHVKCARRGFRTLAGKRAVNMINDDYRLLERIRRGEGLEPLHDSIH